MVVEHPTWESRFVLSHEHLAGTGVRHNFPSALRHVGIEPLAPEDCENPSLCECKYRVQKSSADAAYVEARQHVENRAERMRFTHLRTFAIDAETGEPLEQPKQESKPKGKRSWRLDFGLRRWSNPENPTEVPKDKPPLGIEARESLSVFGVTVLNPNASPITCECRATVEARSKVEAWKKVDRIIGEQLPDAKIQTRSERELV